MIASNNRKRTTINAATIVACYCYSLASIETTNAFVSQQQQLPTIPASALHMGLFDGVKESFDSPPPGTKSSDRETPIDRWFGWSTTSDDELKKEQEKANIDASNFVDSMDSNNYAIVELTKPMGIRFEENDDKFGGIYVQSLEDEGSAIDSNIVINKGDQLISVDNNKVSGMGFDDAIGKIIDSNSEKTKLIFFRGTAKQFYGPTGPSNEWLDEFVANS